MTKITFLGAGSTIFAKNIIGDCLLTPALKDSHFALYDIDENRLNESKMMIDNLNKNINKNKAKITAHLGIDQRKEALKNSDFIINAIQVGGYNPSTLIDFEVPKKYGLNQTIGDTLGIGGIFRGLRTISALMDFTTDIYEVCPDAFFLNYSNPMAILTGALLKKNIKTVGLCHSVQTCADTLLKGVELSDSIKNPLWKIAGINHQAWLLEIVYKGKDIYPEIKKRAEKINKQARIKGNKKHDDMVRFEVMKHFGYYITESSEHNAEYMPYWIKKNYPELIEEFNIPLDEYPRRCIKQIEEWNDRKKELISNNNITHERTYEYGSFVMEAIKTNKAITINGNILNTGLITNLPDNAIVEVPCLVDGNGIKGVFYGNLPEQCAALNRTNINVQILTIEAALTLKREYIYHAAFLDPHTSSELSLDQIVNLCDDLITAHGNMLPVYK
jgi:alpha-galactosidase